MRLNTMLSAKIVFSLLCAVALMGCVSPPFTHKPPTTNTDRTVLEANQQMLAYGASPIDSDAAFKLTYMIYSGLPVEKANQFAKYANTPEVKAELAKTVRSPDFIENVGEAASIFSNITAGMNDVSLSNALFAGLSFGIATLAGQERVDIRKRTSFAQGTYITDERYEGMTANEATTLYNTEFRVQALKVAESLGYAVECIQYCERTTQWSSFLLTHATQTENYYSDDTGELIPTHIWLRLTYGELEEGNPSEFAVLGEK